MAGFSVALDFAIEERGPHVQVSACYLLPECKMENVTSRLAHGNIR